MSATPTTSPQADPITGSWRIDPARSSAEFHVRHFYGLVTVKGHFDRFDGTLDLDGAPSVELTIDADSLETNNRQRDKHLRSKDFFDVEHHPQVQFVSDTATLDGETLSVRGRLYAGGADIPLAFETTIHQTDGELETEAVTQVDHRKLGMTWSPLGILRAPSTLIVHARLVRDAGAHE
jgi:polyisoprenoid-binding protein YceI